MTWIPFIVYNYAHLLNASTICFLFFIFFFFFYNSQPGAFRVPDCICIGEPFPNLNMATRCAYTRGSDVEIRLDY